MIIGFTGTQRGMTHPQFAMVRTLLSKLEPDEVHHGDCVGADAQFDAIARDLDIPVVVHPPSDDKKRARVPSNGKTTYLEPKSYKERNHDIINASTLLIAVPHRPEYLRSGTWSTVRYARLRHKTVIIVEPVLGKEKVQ